MVSSVTDDQAERHIGIQDDDAWKKKKKRELLTGKHVDATQCNSKRRCIHHEEKHPSGQIRQL